MKLDKYTVGRRYGKALFELAMEEQQTAEVYQDLLSLRAIYQLVPDLGNILSDVRLEPYEKRGIMEQLVTNYTGITHDFLEVVYNYNRMDDLLLMITEYERRYDDLQSLVLGTVTTAIPLTAEQKARLEDKVAGLFGYQQARLENKIDANIIGGVKVEANNKVVDGSIAAKLAQVQKLLNT